MQALIPYFPVIQLTIPLPDFFAKEALVLHGFGFFMGIAIIYGAVVTLRRAERKNLDIPTFKELYFWLVLGIIVGGKLGFGLFYFPREHLANPLLFLNFSNGLSSFGGFIACSIAFICVLRRRKKNILPYADNIMYGFSFGWIFGRLACTLNHEHPGSASNFVLARYCRPVEGWTLDLPSWLIQIPADYRFSHCIEQGKSAVTHIGDTVASNYAGVVAVHDMGFYEVLYALALFTTYWLLDKKPRPDGLFLLIMIYSYAPIRFMMDFLRPLEGNARYYHLTPAQWGCLGFLVVMTAAIIYYRRHFSFLPFAAPASAVK